VAVPAGKLVLVLLRLRGVRPLVLSQIMLLGLLCELLLLKVQLVAHLGSFS